MLEVLNSRTGQRFVVQSIIMMITTAKVAPTKLVIVRKRHVQLWQVPLHSGLFQIRLTPRPFARMATLPRRSEAAAHPATTQCCVAILPLPYATSSSPAKG